MKHVSLIYARELVNTLLKGLNNMAMTFRPSKSALKSIEQIKKDLNIATNNKVINYVLEQLPVVQRRLEKAYSELEETTDDLRNMNEIIVDKFRSDQEYNKMIQKLVSK